MRYPSLSNVRLLLIDGRQWNNRLGIILRGSLLAVLDNLDSHILVIVSNDRHVEEVEKMGEAAGAEMYFHGESVETNAEFLDRCKYAETILIPNQNTRSDVEISSLVTMGKRLLLLNDVQLPSFSGTERIFVIDGSNSVNICKELKHLSLMV
jgi:hypothetical protein